VEPAWSPDGNRVAFARIASDGSSYIYILDFNTLTVVQWTQFVDANGNRPRDRQPTWGVIRGSFYLVFASTRKSGQPHQLGLPSDRVDVTNNIYDIYYMPTDLPEPPSADETLSLTTDPSTPALARPDVPGVEFFVRAAGAKYPAAAIETRNRVAYHSTRTQGAEAPGPGVHDLWETAVFDRTPPLMEILPVVRPKEMFPGDTVEIKVRVLDLQSGVDFVRVQFKDPDSAEQDAAGEEHKLYQLFQFDPFFPNRILADTAQAYVPLFVEVGQQAIHPQTYEYKEPYSLVRLGFNGSLDDTLLLQPELDENGNPTDWYVARWRTPDIPSDFYLDVIVRDRAGNEFIYDNVSGFTTQQFTGAHNILLVSDYMGGQIFVQNRVDVIGNSITRPTWQPVESYWTDNPTGKPPFDVTQPPSGTGLTIFGDGAIPHPNVLGAFIRSDTLGSNTTYGNLYNIWRVQCRNPITPAVLAGYQPRIEREPTDLAGGFRDKLHAPRMVIWASPYAGNVWAGPGHILDPEVQTLIRNFLQGSGRMLFSGQDIAWALSLRGSVANQFMNDILRVSFDSDTADDVFAIPYRGLRHELQGVLGDPQRGEDPNPFAENPAGIIMWIRYEGNTIVPDSPLTLRLSHPAAYLVFPTFDLFDVIQPLGATSTTPLYTDAAWNQVWLDTVSVATTARVPYTYTQPRVGNLPLLGTSNQAGSYYINDANRSKVAFMAFGIEGVNSGYTTGPSGLLWCRSLRNKLVHNAFGWMTHSVLEGVVRQYDPDTRTFTPLPRALVRVIGVAPLSLVGVNAGYAITDSNGFYRIVGLEAGGYIVDAERPGFKTQHPETVVLVAETATINLIMLATPPGQISGRVIDINNQPVRGALVRATNTTDPELTREIVTDPDGTFLIPRVPVGTWDVTVVSLAFGGYSLPPAQPTPDGVYRNVQVRSGETTAVGDFVLEPEPGTVTGTVSDVNTGQPIANARVTAVAGANTRADRTTDENGVYRFSVPAGEYVITAVAPGYAPESQTLNVPANQTTTLNFQLALLPPGSASGRIVRRFGGAPEPGVTVRLLFGTTEVVPPVTTDANGNYSFTNVPPGEYVVIPEKTGFTFIPNQRTITVNPNQNTVVGEFKSEPLRTFLKGRSLVSAPYDYTQDVRELLAVPASATFRFFTWNPSQLRYVFYPNAPANRFQLGRGYFLETSEDLPLTREGTPADTSQPFRIPLQVGWNLIGNPFTFEVDWGQVQVVDPDTNTSVSLPTAVGKGIVANALWGYSLDRYTATTRMRVWEGYWVYAYRATTLVIPPTAASSGASGRSANTSAAGWRLTLEVQSGELKDCAYIGVSRSATAGYDREHDLLKPPPVGTDYVHISLPRLSWGAHSGVYGVDIQPATRSASWEFVVESSQPNREVTLRWPDAQQLPRAANLVLVNLETGERRYLRTTGAYTFRTNANGVSRFRLEMASSGGLLRIQQVQVQSGRGAQHTVAFQLTGDATVQVNILAGGKVVRQLLNQATRSGVQQATWDGRDQSGVALPPGTYTVEIRAVSDDGQVARATAPLVLTR